MHWRDFRDGPETLKYLRDHIAQPIRQGRLDLGRPHYALTLAMGVMSAIFCNVGKIVAVEFGVGGGSGLLDLCKAAEYFRGHFGIEIEVYGLDNATGLPEAKDYRDQPEIWAKGAFLLRDPDALRARLPSFAHLVIGDIAETVHAFRHILSAESPLGFASIDVDYYSSTVSCLDILRHAPACYMPAVPLYFDDFQVFCMTANDSCGEPLAIAEFNRANMFRKVQESRYFNTMAPAGRPYHGCHVLDHPLRTGQVSPRDGFHFLSLQFL
jgi:hypothetical protein